MKRREFLQNSVVLSGGVMIGLGSNAVAATNEEIIQSLQDSNRKNECQSINHQEYELALKEMKPSNSNGIVTSSIGCRSPHKHLIYIDERFLKNPELIEEESDTTLPNGARAKVFLTSPSFDMSWVVKNLVGQHRHELILTKEDLTQIGQHNAAVQKIAYQKKWPFIFLSEPGHLFVLTMQNLQ